MSFVPERSSYCIHMTKSTDSAILKTTVLSTIMKTIRMRHSLQTSRFAFSSRNGVRFQFTWYQNEMSYQNENFVRIENRNELIPERLVRDLTFVSVSCKQIQRNIWGWNELVLEWKSFQYHVNGPLQKLAARQTVVTQVLRIFCRSSWHCRSQIVYVVVVVLHLKLVNKEPFSVQNSVTCRNF